MIHILLSILCSVEREREIETEINVCVSIVTDRIYIYTYTHAVYTYVGQFGCEVFWYRWIYDVAAAKKRTSSE